MVHVAAWQITDTSGTHNKYYRAYVAGPRVVYQYGRIGTVQSTEVSDTANPIAVIQAATRKLDSKLNDRRKNYRSDGPTLVLDVPSAAWADPRQNPYELDAGFAVSRGANRTLSGSISDDAAHVVALAGSGRRSPSTLIAPLARAHATHPLLDVTVAVLDAKAARNADRNTVPRAALLDLGAAEPGDDNDVLAAALRLWTPETGSAPQAHLQVCLENARMIFAKAVPA